MAEADPLDRETFFAIMGAFPTGVTIVAAIDDNGEPRGLTLSAICSVSAQPPLMLVCVDKASNTLPAIRHSKRFAVNYLTYGHHEVASVFASKAADKFAAVAWRPAGNGMPWLHEDAFAIAECTVTQEVDAGDHIVFIASVDGGRRPDPNARPLVYFRRTYSTCERP